MKKLLIFCLMAVLGTGIGQAQNKKERKAEKNTVTTVFLTDLNCEHCAKKIMDNIPFEKGVKDVKVDVPTKKVTVCYDPAKNTDEGLIRGFAKIRVKAEKDEGQHAVAGAAHDHAGHKH